MTPSPSEVGSSTSRQPQGPGGPNVFPPPTRKPLPPTPSRGKARSLFSMRPVPRSSGADSPPSLSPGSSQAIEKSSQSPHPSLYNAWADDWWLLEILSALLGVGAVVAICIILKSYDDRPLPDWGSLFGSRITLNSVLSVLGLVAKASLMIPVVECISQLKWAWYTKRERPLGDFYEFDNASRGVWGSIKLIWKTRGLHLAALGGLLTILTLAIDPFIQQSVLYSTRNVQDESKEASAKSVEHWIDTGTKTRFYPSTTTIGSIYEATLGWNSTLASLADVPPVCASGNCTWDPYASLAICASASDVTSHLASHYHNYSKDDPGPPYWITKLPGGQYFELVNAPGVNDSPFMNVTANDIGAISNGTGEVPFPSSIAFANSKNPIANAFAIWMSGDGEDLIVNEKTHYSKAFKAVEFEFNWCVQTYETTMSLGKASTHLSNKIIAYSDFTEVPHDKGDNSPHNLVSKALGQSGIDFTVDGDTHASLQQYFQQLFTGEVKQQGGNAGMVNQDEACSGNGAFPNSAPRAISQALLGAQNRSGIDGLSMMLQNIAIALTNQNRRASDSTAPGLTFKSQTLVDVQWVWLSLLFVFMVLSLVFFIVTIVHQRSATIWKSSSLAVLHGFDPELRHHLGPLTRQTTMQGQAKQLMVRLENRGQGQRLTV